MSPGLAGPHAQQRGPPPPAVNKANYLLMGPSWCQAGAGSGSPMLGTSSDEQHCQALAQHHKASALELQSTLHLGNLLRKSALVRLLQAPLPRAITEPPRRIANGVWLPVAACVGTTRFPPYPPAPQTWVFMAFWQGFATQRRQEPCTLLACLARHAASQSQLGSFAATKCIPEDPLLSEVGSHHQAMLCSHPRISPTSSTRTGRSHVVAHARVGWERPCSHGTAAWPDPLRMLEPGRPRPLVVREEPAGFSLAPRGGLVVPTTSQTHILQWHQLLSPAGPGATGHVLAGQGWVRWVCALLTPRRCFGDCQGGGSSWGRS